jgi:predicted ATPase
MTTPPLVGRERELAALQEALARALQGNGSLVLVSGEAGIGKTSLVQRLVTEAREQGALVLTGAAYDLSATPPYGPWLELTDRYPDDPTIPELPEILQRGTGVGDLRTQTELSDLRWFHIG